MWRRKATGGSSHFRLSFLHLVLLWVGQQVKWEIESRLKMGREGWGQRY